jgi:hypothetical protein
MAAAALATGCNVSASAPSSTGPVAGNSVGPDCARGTVVLLTDYMSAQIALSSGDGTTLSAAFLSTASTTPSGLAFPLSGDVVLPGTRPPSGRVVLLDRFGTNVVTWADPKTAQVLGQLPVGTGFESNPQDYLELADGRAYLSRYGSNMAPGTQPFDAGNDVLVLDTTAGAPAITKSIPMPVGSSGLPPRPAGLALVGSTVLVVLQETSEDFMTVGDGVLVGLASDAVAWQVAVTGLKNCGRPALSPSGTKLALACEGQLDEHGDVVDPGASAVAIYDVTTLPPTLARAYPIADQLGATTQDRVAWVSETELLGKTQTGFGGTTNNQAFTLDLTSGKAAVLLTASPASDGTGKGIVYGDVQCSPGCANVCLLADADVGHLRRWHIAGADLEPLADVTVDPGTGLPPVGLSEY